jgi:CheY-like chemotaxis protein
VDEGKIPSDGGFVPCQSCGTTILLKVQATAVRSSDAPSPPPVPRRAAQETDRAGEVCCPRCNLHFVPDAQKKPKAGGRPTLLVVEDMEYFLQIARDALAERYEVKTARTVDEARVQLLRGGIDLLLLDLTLSNGEDGLQLLRESPGKTCPVLLFTAQDESEMYGESWAHLRALGVDDVIIKGMNMDEALLRKVAEMLGQTIPQDAYRR